MKSYSSEGTLFFIRICPYLTDNIIRNKKTQTFQSIYAHIFLKTNVKAITIVSTSINVITA